MDSPRRHSRRPVCPSTSSGGNLDHCARLDGYSMHSKCQTLRTYPLPLHRPHTISRRSHRCSCLPLVSFPSNFADGWGWVLSFLREAWSSGGPQSGHGENFRRKDPSYIGRAQLYWAREAAQSITLNRSTKALASYGPAHVLNARARQSISPRNAARPCLPYVFLHLLGVLTEILPGRVANAPWLANRRLNPPRKPS